MAFRSCNDFFFKFSFLRSLFLTNGFLQENACSCVSIEKGLNLSLGTRSNLIFFITCFFYKTLKSKCILSNASNNLKKPKHYFYVKKTQIISIWYLHQGKHLVTFCRKFNAVKEGYMLKFKIGQALKFSFSKKATTFETIFHLI